MGRSYLVDLLIENCTRVITVDRERRVIKNGAIAIENGKVVEVGKTNNLTRKYDPELKINAQGKIAIPGLINCHVHSAETLLRGIEDGWRLLDWLKKRVWPLKAQLTEETAPVGVQLCCLEMLRTGTTTFLGTMVLPHYGFDKVAETVEKSGMKAALAYLIDHEKPVRPKTLPTPEELLKNGIGLAKKWKKKSQRIKVWFESGIVEVCELDLYQKITEEARRYNIGISQHLGEIAEDAELLRNKYGKSVIEFAREAGLTGPSVVLVHEIWLNQKDIKILADTGTNVCHCPTSNMKLASGFAKVPEMLDQKVNVALGTDEGPCNDCYDMFGEMKLAALIHKGRLLSPTAVTAEQAIEMATVNGARALGWEKTIGSIEVGKSADIVLLNAKAPHMVPHRNLVSNLVYSARGSDVDTVLVDGKIVVENGKVKTIDERSLLEKIIEIGEGMDKAAGIKIKSRWKEI